MQGPPWGEHPTEEFKIQNPKNKILGNFNDQNSKQERDEG
jgi:hypothetical protein